MYPLSPRADEHEAEPLHRVAGNRTAPKAQIVLSVAEGFADDRDILLGRYLVTRLVDGWTTLIVLSGVRPSDGIETRQIVSDGPTHAAQQAVDLWKSITDD